MVPVITELLPHPKEFAYELDAFAGVDFIYLMSGTITVTVGKTRHVMDTADVLWIDGSVTRGYSVYGNVPAEVMMFTFPARSTARS